MIAWIRRCRDSWLGRKPEPAPTLREIALAALMEEWGHTALGRGRGSEIAAAKVKGAKTAIMCLAPAVRNRASGWRGPR